MTMIKYKGQLYKRVDRMRDGNPETAKELADDKNKCRKAKTLIEKLDRDIRDIDYLLGSLAIPSRAVTLFEKGLDTARKEVNERERELDHIRF